MTKPPRYIINNEQCEAHLAAARARNPNASEIESLRGQIKAMSARIAALTSDDERYYGILTAISGDFDSRVDAVKVMSDQEIGDHLSNLFWDHLQGEVDEAIMMEALERMGWAADEDNA